MWVGDNQFDCISSLKAYMKITNSKDAMIMLLVAMRREAILAYQDMEEFTYEEAKGYLMTYVEHVRKARSYGIRLKDVKSMYEYVDAMMQSQMATSRNDVLEIRLTDAPTVSQLN